MLLENKIALVTGAGRGIGSEVARLFASEGATVIVHYHQSREPAEKLAAEIGRGAIALAADLADPDSAQNLIDDGLKAFGHIDILVNCGSSFAHDLTAEQAHWEDYQKEFGGVVGAVVNPTHAILPSMKAQGHGRIINFVATLLQRPAIEHIVHTTCKSAIVGYTRTLARDVGEFGITVNMVSPGMTMTQYSTELPQYVQDSVRKQTPLRRLATAEDVAKVVLFYASPLADFVSGANLAPDGGLVIL